MQLGIQPKNIDQKVMQAMIIKKKNKQLTVKLSQVVTIRGGLFEC